MKNELETLQQRMESERTAWHEAESILEKKATELFLANAELARINLELEQQVTTRTVELHAEQSRLRSLITNLDSGILLENESRHIVLVNEFFCRIFGIPAPPAALEGMDCSQSAEQSKMLFADPEGFVARIDQLLAERKICSNELLYLTDGRVFYRTFIPVFSEETYLGHLWKYRDVTEGHRANEALRHSEEKYRGLIENMELGLMEVDNDGIIIRAYPRFCEMVGYTDAELVGKSATEKFIVPEFLPVLEKQHTDRAKGKAGAYEIQIFKKNGAPIWVLISGAPIFDSDNRIVGSLGIHYDVTKQKDLQRDLEEARRSAEAAQEAEKQFLANMSHEIRTPLNAIIGMAHLLYDTQPTPEQMEYLDVLRNSAEILRNLISDVLDLSKIRAGHVEVQEKPFDLVGLVRSLVKSAQMRLEDRPVTIEAIIDPQIKNLVLGDDLLLNQILSNLLGNAEKFTSKGRIKVTVQCLKQQAGSDHGVEIRVADSGIGIPPEKHALIFQTFRQVDGDIRRKFGGTGLGLAITRQLVELQGGSIRVESELGQGSTFIVQLPYQDSGKPITDEDHPELDFQSLNTQGKRLLVVEDNHMNRKYVGALLRKWNIQHSFAHNGREGVEMARKEHFDLILMDVQMPDMDGYEATIAIRQTVNPNSHTPIIALTASALVSQKDKAFQAGMNDYLSKPFKPAQLFEKLELFCCNLDETEVESHTLVEEGSFKFHSRLDAAILNDLYGGDLDYAREMFEIFLKNIDPEFKRLRTLLAAGQIVEFAQLAHKIKPSFSMVGLPDLEQQLQQLETEAKAEISSLETLRTWFAQLEENLPAALAAVTADFEKLKIENP